jgi:hypothetical protein
MVEVAMDELFSSDESSSDNDSSTPLGRMWGTGTPKPFEQTRENLALLASIKKQWVPPGYPPEYPDLSEVFHAMSMPWVKRVNLFSEDDQPEAEASDDAGVGSGSLSAARPPPPKSCMSTSKRLRQDCDDASPTPCVSMANPTATTPRNVQFGPPSAATFDRSSRVGQFTPMSPRLALEKYPLPERNKALLASTKKRALLRDRVAPPNLGPPVRVKRPMSTYNEQLVCETKRNTAELAQWEDVNEDPSTFRLPRRASSRLCPNQGNTSLLGEEQQNREVVDIQADNENGGIVHRKLDPPGRFGPTPGETAKTPAPSPTTKAKTARGSVSTAVVPPRAAAIAAVTPMDKQAPGANKLSFRVQVVVEKAAEGREPLLTTSNKKARPQKVLRTLCPNRKQCRIEGCEKFIRSIGLCGRHGGGARCSTEGCPNIANRAKVGLCITCLNNMAQ